MSKSLYKNITIIDYAATKLSATKIENMLDFFKIKLATTEAAGAREARYDLGDSTLARQRGLDGFELHLRRRENVLTDGDGYIWTAEFTRGEKLLKVTGKLTEDDAG